MMIVGRNEVLVIDLYVGLEFEVIVDDDDDNLCVDKCVKDDFVYFESVGVVCCWLLPTPK